MEDTKEALEFIAALPKIIEKSYGNQAWKWFDKDVFDKYCGYEWSETRGLYSEEDDLEQQERIADFGKIEHLNENDDWMLDEAANSNFSFSFDLSEITALNPSDLDMRTVGGGDVTFASNILDASTINSNKSMETETSNEEKLNPLVQEAGPGGRQ